MTADGKDFTYRFDKPSGILYLDDNSDSTEYILCRNVESMTFNRAYVPGAPGVVRNVRIVMTVTDPGSGVSQTLAAAAVVRRNL
jgi:hypothetical protein